MLNTAIQAARAAADEIMRIYSTADFGVEMKADNSPLTLADKAAHNAIMRHLLPTGIPVLSEEGAHLPFSERKDWHRLWIVDPLDGTKEFIKRNGEFTVNIALVEDGTPVLGVIVVPVTGRTYAADVRARRLDTSPSVPDGSVVGSPFTVVASRSHLNEETAAFIDRLRQQHPDLQCISSGSSLKICLVAEGKADVYPRFAPTMEWDTAAGDAIARAAGCAVVDAHTGTPLIYNKEDLHNPHFIVTRTK